MHLILTPCPALRPYKPKGCMLLRNSSIQVNHAVSLKIRSCTIIPVNILLLAVPLSMPKQTTGYGAVRAHAKSQSLQVLMVPYVGHQEPQAQNRTTYATSREHKYVGRAAIWVNPNIESLIRVQDPGRHEPEKLRLKRTNSAT